MAFNRRMGRAFVTIGPLANELRGCETETRLANTRNVTEGVPCSASPDH